LKISLKCGEQFVIKNEGENEPFLITLVSNINEDSKDLAPHQKLMFYEAIGNMVSKEADFKKQSMYVQKMMSVIYDEWTKIFEEANKNPEVLLNTVNIRNIDLILKINERVAFSAGTSYFSFGSYIYDNIIKMYSYYSNMVNQAYQTNNQFNSTVKVIKITKRTILKFLQTLVKYNEDKEGILKFILPPLSGLIDQYRTSHFENRDPDVLLVFSEILTKLKNAQYEYINSIWNYLCLFTLEMIKSDFQSFPEHRMNFFTLIKALIFNAFDALFQIQDSNFNKDVLNAIIWAFKHDQPLISETGLETLLILINVTIY
jgi:exportin-1